MTDLGTSLQRHRSASTPPTGCFVALEGGEGAGKSTQARRLEAWLAAEGYDVLLTHEPGDTEIGRKLRRIVLDPATGAMSHRTEALLYAADKAEHVERRRAGAGAGGRRGDRPLRRLARWPTRAPAATSPTTRSSGSPGGRPATCGRTSPCCSTCEPEPGLTRFEERDRIEGESLEFHERVRDDVPAAGPGPARALPRRRRPRADRGDRGADPRPGRAAADGGHAGRRTGRRPSRGADAGEPVGHTYADGEGAG